MFTIDSDEFSLWLSRCVSFCKMYLFQFFTLRGKEMSGDNFLVFMVAAGSYWRLVGRG